MNAMLSLGFRKQAGKLEQMGDCKLYRDDLAQRSYKQQANWAHVWYPFCVHMLTECTNVN
jgi:hypothetical protein